MIDAAGVVPLRFCLSGVSSGGRLFGEGVEGR
jgi:hypothetical protein